MSQNTSPIFSLVPIISAAQLTSSATANTKSDGSGTIGTDIFKVVTGDPTNGSFISKLRISSAASVASTAMGASVIRIYLSNKTSGATSSADTWLFQELTAAANTADSSATPSIYYEVPINLALPPNYTLLVSIHAQPLANTLWQVVAVGGNY